MCGLQLTNKQKSELERKHYGIVGKHSAVQVCDWTKKSMRNEGECYKNKFYGIETFACAQISPNALWCDQNCVFCWRPAENMKRKEIKETVDTPKVIVSDVLKQKHKLLVGYKGYKNVNLKKLEAALKEFPSHWAISLSGEPTLYPKLSELIKEINKGKPKSIFLVTNGQNPDAIEKLRKKNTLPTQLYISLTATNQKQYNKINRGIRKDSFARLLKSLRALRNLSTRTVVRLTLIKGLNTDQESLKGFAKIIEMAQPDFIEVKAYMHIGYSRKRLEMHNMPTHLEIKRYCRELEKHLRSFKYEDEDRPSRIVLYMNTGRHRAKKVPKRWIIERHAQRISKNKLTEFFIFLITLIQGLIINEKKKETEKKIVNKKTGIKTRITNAKSKTKQKVNKSAKKAINKKQKNKYISKKQNIKRIKFKKQ